MQQSTIQISSLTSKDTAEKVFRKLSVMKRRSQKTDIKCKTQMANKWLVLVIVLTHHNDACAKKVYALSNKHLKIAYYEWEPMFKINKNPDGSETYSGILGNLVLLMQQRRNITFTLIKEPNGMWGNCQGNNNCTGMMAVSLC